MAAVDIHDNIEVADTMFNSISTAPFPATFFAVFDI